MIMRTNIGKKAAVEIEAKLKVVLRNYNGQRTYCDVTVRGEVYSKSEVSSCSTANELLVKILKSKIDQVCTEGTTCSRFRELLGESESKDFPGASEKDMKGEGRLAGVIPEYE